MSAMPRSPLSASDAAAGEIRAQSSTPWADERFGRRPRPPRAAAGGRRGRAKARHHRSRPGASLRRDGGVIAWPYAASVLAEPALEFPAVAAARDRDDVEEQPLRRIG